MMLVRWVTDDGEVHHAERTLAVKGNVVVLHMQVESLGESDWDWHVWDQSGREQQRYGLVDTLAQAKARAEGAVDALAWVLG